MKTVTVVGVGAGALMVLLVGLIVRSSLEMSLAAGLRATVDTWWGVTTMVDLYAGLIVVAVWIAHRERSALRAVPWIIGLLLLGNLTTLVYVVLAAVRSRTMDELIRGNGRR